MAKRPQSRWLNHYCYRANFLLKEWNSDVIEYKSAGSEKMIQALKNTADRMLHKGIATGNELGDAHPADAVKSALGQTGDPENILGSTLTFLGETTPY